MRKAGKTFLPKYESESEKNYKVRLAVAVLTSFFKKTARNMGGRVFAKPPTYSEDMDKNILKYTENIDLQGNELSVAAAEWFIDALCYGMGYILVDFPQTNAEETKTVEAEKKSGVRPYWVWLNVSQVNYIESDSLNNIKIAIITEYVNEIIDNSQVAIKQYRVLRPGSWELWRESKDSNKQKRVYVKTDEGKTTINFVPIIPYYTDKKRQFLAQPPLLDLAYLNIAHYQGRSNQQNALTVAQFPILAATGWRPDIPRINAAGVPDNADPLVIGPKKVLHSENENAKFFYVEHSGAAIEAGRSYLSDLVDEITMLGNQLLIPKVNNPQMTATESNNRNDENLSDLERMSKGFQDALNLALEYTAIWIKSNNPGSIALNGKFDLPKGTTDQQSLLQMRATGDLTRDTLYSEFKRRGVLSDSFDAETEKEMLQNEPPDMGI